MDTTPPPNAVPPHAMPALPIDAPTAKPRRRVSLPGWLAVLLLIGVAGGFGYLGWRLIRPDPAVDLSQYEPNEGGRRARAWANNPGQPPQIFRPAAPPAPPPEGVTV